MQRITVTESLKLQSHMLVKKKELRESQHTSGKHTSSARFRKEGNKGKHQSNIQFITNLRRHREADEAFTDIQ